MAGGGPHSDYQGSFMPWADLGKEHKIGPVIFWPHRAMAAKKIKDVPVRQHVRRLLRRYVNNDGTQVKGPAVVSHGAVDFRKLTKDEWADVHTAVDALIFSIIYPNNLNGLIFRDGGDAPSSDRYKTYRQGFTPGNDDIAIRAGSRLNFWKMGKLQFQAPWCLGGTRCTPDEKVLAGLSNMWAPDFDPDVRRRVVKSLEWFRLAHSEVDEITPFNKVVMMATAFEILVQCGSEKAKDMRNKFNRVLAFRDSIIEPRIIKDRIKNDIKVDCIKAAWWIWDFYALRNAIAHGDDVPVEKLMFDKTLTQLDVADAVFGELVVWELEKYAVNERVQTMLRDIRSWNYSDLVGPLEPSCWGLAVRHTYRITEYHRKLGWAKAPPKAKFEMTK
jgi:hypothetical protein